MIFDRGNVYLLHRHLGGEDEKYDTMTGDRVLRYAEELAEKRNYSKFTTFESPVDEMVISNNLRVFSICEHHLLPYFGDASIGYIPAGKILGLSKMQRIIDKFASKPTTQEHLTSEILNFLMALLTPKGAIVRIKAVHTCMVYRGTQSANANFITTAMSDSFKLNSASRQEFLSQIDIQ